MRTFPVLASLALAMLIGPALVPAQSLPPHPQVDSPSAPVAQSNAAFVMQAAQLWLAQVEAAHLALARSDHFGVQDFGQRMIRSHAQWQSRLRDIAAELVVPMPHSLSDEHRLALRRLRSADDGEFDKQYVASFGVRAHRNAVKLFEREAAVARDPRLKLFAAQALPAAAEHLASAEDLERRLKRDSSGRLGN